MQDYIKLIAERQDFRTPVQNSYRNCSRLKDKMAADIGSQVESLMQGGRSTFGLGGLADGLKDKIGDFFGK